MPSCAPNYANAGYQEYFNTAPANCAQYVNTASCTQYSYTNGAGTYTAYSNACADSTNVTQYTKYGYNDSFKYFNSSDDCSQYGKYSNSVSYTKNTSQASAYALGITESLITGMDKISDSVDAIKHLRDKMTQLVANKGYQATEGATTNLSDVEDVDFDDSNANTTEKLLVSQFQQLKTKVTNLANALKASGGNSNIGTLSSSDESSGSIAHKQDVVNLMNDMKAIAASCYQTYSNHQNYVNGYVNYSVNACTNAAYAVYSRTDYGVQYTRFTCSTNYTKSVTWKECCNATGS